MAWDEFVTTTPVNSIALDGVVLGGPKFDPITNHINLDHHDGVVREATMSTAKQAYFAIKGGLIECFAERSPTIYVWINDTDQDTSLAVWLITNYSKFTGTKSIPHFNRLLAINDNWDITGGAFPIDLKESIVRQHNWVFEPYTNLRKSGKLAVASKSVLRANLTEVMTRLDKFLVGLAGEKALDTRHEIYYDSPRFKIVNEIGGNDARYYLFANGMNAFISIVTTRPDGRTVYSVGRRSQYIRFPIETLYNDYNEAEGLTRANGWNGSTIIGGSSRLNGSGLSWERLRDITNERLKKDGII